MNTEQLELQRDIDQAERWALAWMVSALVWGLGMVIWLCCVRHPGAGDLLGSAVTLMLSIWGMCKAQRHHNRAMLLVMRLQWKVEHADP